MTTPLQTLLNALTPITTDENGQQHIVAIAPTNEIPGFTTKACWEKIRTTINPTLDTDQITEARLQLLHQALWHKDLSSALEDALHSNDWRWWCHIYEAFEGARIAGRARKDMAWLKDFLTEWAESLDRVGALDNVKSVLDDADDWWN
jgi:hypothetical protein